MWLLQKQPHVQLSKISASNIPTSVWFDTVTESKSPHPENTPKISNQIGDETFSLTHSYDK